MDLTEFFLFWTIVSYSLYLIYAPFIIFLLWCPLSVSALFCINCHCLVHLFIFCLSSVTMSYLLASYFGVFYFYLRRRHPHLHSSPV